MAAEFMKSQDGTRVGIEPDPERPRQIAGGWWRGWTLRRAWRSACWMACVAALGPATVVWIAPAALHGLRTQDVAVDPFRYLLGTAAAAEAGRPAEPPPARKSFRDPLKTGGYGPEMVWIPGGTFTMGSPASEPVRRNDEGPQHTVTVPAFALGRTEVSFADYDRFAEATDRQKPNDAGWGRGERPVIHVSLGDARAYAAWLSEQTGQRYRLPSEAEWEYAARAGTTTPFWTGACINTQQVNYDGTYDHDSCGAKTGRFRGQTVAVGSLPANAFGLHEMAGNVWEWTEDCWHDSYAGAPNDGSVWRETGGGDCGRRVLRGGSWNYYPLTLRSAARNWFTADVARANASK